MTSVGKYILPIMPISWLIFGVLIIVSYLISKSVDICFDHYLINYSKNKNRDLIKARFKGELQKIIKRKKKKKNDSSLIIKAEEIKEDNDRLEKKLELYGIKVSVEKEIYTKCSNSNFKQNEMFKNDLITKIDKNYVNNKIISSVNVIKKLQTNLNDNFSTNSCDDILDRNKTKRIDTLTPKGSFDNILEKNFEKKIKQNSSLIKTSGIRDISKGTSTRTSISNSINNFYDTYSTIRNNNIETGLIKKSRNKLTFLSNSNACRKNLIKTMTLSNENLLDDNLNQNFTIKNNNRKNGLLRIVVYQTSIGINRSSNLTGSYV